MERHFYIRFNILKENLQDCLLSIKIIFIQDAAANVFIFADKVIGISSILGCP